MKQSYRKLSLANRGLRYKLKIAFCLTAILPTLAFLYIISMYVLPRGGMKPDITAIMVISVFIAIFGFYVVKDIFDRIVSVSTEAKRIASGDLNRRLNVTYKDEVGDLGTALNQLTERIRNNMDELRDYGSKNPEISSKAQESVIVLSSLLQISSLISQGAKLEDILKITVQKSRLMANSDVAYLFVKQENKDVFQIRSVDGRNSNYLLGLELVEDQELLKRIFERSSEFILDKNNQATEEAASFFCGKLRLKSTLVLPVFVRGKVFGVLGIGNTEGEAGYEKNDSELLDVFAKQVAIAIENDILMNRIEKLEIKDALTGLYNRAFIFNRLREEIKRAIAYQRPCAFIIFDIDNFKLFHQNFGLLQTEATLKKITTVIRDSVTEVDRVGRTGDDEFGVILPEKNKRQAMDTAEDIRRKIEFIFGEDSDNRKKITVSAGVSENPLDGIDSEELMGKAKELLQLAKKEGKNKVACFKEPPVCR